MSDYEREDESAVEERKNVFRDKYKKVADYKELIRLMADAKVRKEAADEEKKMRDAEYDVLRIERVPEAMEGAGIENVRLEGIGRVSLTGDMWVKVADKGGFFGWLKKHKLGDLIVPQVNGSTLKAFVKGRMKAGKEVPESLKVTPYTRASITKG